MRLSNYFAAMVLTTFLYNYMHNLFFYFFFKEFMNMKSNMIMLIGSKLLENKILSNDELSKGKLINLVQIDCYILQEVCEELVFLFMIVLMVLFSSIAGIALLSYIFCYFYGIWALLLSLMGLFLYIGKRLDVRTMEARDNRISLVNTIFTNIRFVKFSGLEGYFFKLTD